MNSIPFYIGTYTSGSSQGIYCSELNLTDGKMSPPKLVAVLANPSFLAIHPSLDVLYSTSEVRRDGKREQAKVIAFKIAAGGMLQELGSFPAGGDGPCFVSTDGVGKLVFVANYSSGSVSAFSVGESGELLSKVCNIQHVGQMPYGRWVTDASNKRNNASTALITNEQANYLANAMRSVVTQGTAKRLANTSIAGKTGTAENQKGKASHSWFIGFAPYNAPAQQRIAFSVIVEHGSYGGRLAAPIAGEIVAAAFNPPAATLAQKQGEKRAR